PLLPTFERPERKVSGRAGWKKKIFKKTDGNITGIERTLTLTHILNPGYGRVIYGCIIRQATNLYMKRQLKELGIRWMHILQNGNGRMEFNKNALECYCP